MSSSGRMWNRWLVVPEWFAVKTAFVVVMEMTVGAGLASAKLECAAMMDLGSATLECVTLEYAAARVLEAMASGAMAAM